jgi:TolB-like protein/DNA-binding winged helix-turn-helix (wHTH) protein/Flp pilus assembly protein TadD
LATRRECRERVLFGDYELDCRTGELQRNGTTLRLQPQPAKVLSILVSRAGEVVTREELAEQIWGSDTYVDFEHGLNFAIRKIRSVLDDDSEEPRYLETVPKRGYRFVAAVTDSPQPHKIQPATFPLVPAHNRPRLLLVSLAMALMLIALVSAIHWWPRSTAANQKIGSLAVLPLANLSGDSEQEYFADGMTEALITTLGKVSALRVISHTSVMRFKHTKEPLPDIARELNADAVVEGTVLRSGNRVRITVNLLYAPSDRHIWAETYERDLRDILSLQDEVARTIANEIKINLTPQEERQLKSAHPVDPEAYQLYLNGRYHLETWSEHGIRLAVDYFERAIQKDPSFALAYAGLTEAAVRAGQKAEKARPSALRALELDNQLSEAHAMMGLVMFRYDWNWNDAETEFERAIELNPNSTVARHYHAHNLLLMGRTDEAVLESKRWIELDPFSPAAHEHLGWQYVGLRRYDEAIQSLLEALKLDPNFHEAIHSLSMAYVQKGMLREAIAQLKRAIDLSPGDERDLAGLTRAYVLSGRRDDALKISRKLTHSSTGGFEVIWVAAAYVALGDKDKAFEWLEKAYRGRDFTFEILKYEPYWDGIRSDPRFTDLLHRIGVPP